MAYKHELEESIHESYEQYRQLIDNSPLAVGAEWNNTIVFMNNAGARLFGVPDPKYLIGKSVIDFLQSDFRDAVKLYFQDTIAGKHELSPLEIKINRADGAAIDVELSATYFSYQNSPAVQFTLYVISKRKNMEAMIFQSKQDWEETFHTITDMITVHDKEFNIIYANKAAQDILNLPEIESASDLKCFKYYHGQECPPRGCPSCSCLKTGTPANFEIYEPHLNMYIEIRSMPRLDRNNQLVGLIHIARDVSERKKVEEAIRRVKDELELRVEERTSKLRIINEQLKDEIVERKTAVEALQKSERKFRNLSQEFDTLLNGIPDNLILLSPDLKIMWANKSVAAEINKDVSDLTGQYCYSACCNLISPCDNCPTLKSFISGNEEASEISVSQDRIWDIRAFPIKDESGKVKSVIELARDITEKINLEAGATRTRHLASIGELAAGVAHEINNPINNIINYGQILIDEFEKENRDDEIARRIIKDGDRIATIVKSLLSFARIRKEEKCLMPLHEIVSDTLSLTSAQIRKDGIHLTVDIPSRPIK
ncbi:MAG: PAS domain-containing protein, partial [Nitrospirota bacterium]